MIGGLNKERSLKAQSDYFSVIKSTQRIRSLIQIVSLSVCTEKSDGNYRMVQFKITLHSFKSVDRMQRRLNYTYLYC